MSIKNNFEEKYGTLLTTIKFRPFFQSISLVVAGAVVIFFFKGAFGYSIGGFMFVTGVVSLLSKDRRVAELYDKGVVIYDEHGVEAIQDFPYSQIVEWNTGLDRENCITFFLSDKTRSSFPTYSTFFANRILKKKMPDLESREIERRKNLEKTRNSPFFKKILNRKKKKNKETK